MTEILLLGCFHFMESDIDFYGNTAQEQLRAISDKIVEFSPDAVAVECASHQQEAIDTSYAICSINDFSDVEKMKNTTLGKVWLFGGEHDISYNNEAIQIGYRVAKTMRHDRVFAIDDDSVLIDIDSQYFSSRFYEMAETLHYKNGDYSIEKQLEFYNTADWSKNNHRVYMEINRIISENSDYLGVEYVSEWYKRNLKIFCNIQKLAQRHKRIFIVYGAGHLKLLRDFIASCDDMVLVDTNKSLFGE